MPNFLPTANSQQPSVVCILTISLACMLFAFNATSQSLTLQLSPSLYGGNYNISCFGTTDGFIDLTVSGGTPPYTYRWSNNETTQDIYSLPAGYYQVNVTDANQNAARADITLTQPLPMEVFIDVFVYPNKFNISCFECFNGMISTHVSGGVYPYEYTWPDDDAIITPDRLGLGSGSYTVYVTDLNGCTNIAKSSYLSEPERSDWTMGGNSGTNPNSDFIGTSDETDLAFRTNGSERLRISAGGQLKISSLAGSESAFIYTDTDGNLLKFGPGTTNPLANFFWKSNGNLSDNGTNFFLGTSNNADLKFKTNNLDRMVITSEGLFGLGTFTPTNFLEFYNTTNYNGITLRRQNLNPNQKNEIIFADHTETQWTIGSNFENGAGGKKSFVIANKLVEPVYGAPALYIDGSNNKIGFGVIPSLVPGFADYRVFVSGGILTNEVKVSYDVNPPDFVFLPEYDLIPLHELEVFISKNSHLPGIPSAKEIIDNQGFELGNMQMLLLQKTEELTLYILQQQKLIEALSEEVRILKEKK